MRGSWGVAGIHWWKALFPFFFQTEAWVTYSNWRAVRIYLEWSHEKRYPCENLIWFILYLLKIITANLKHATPFSVWVMERIWFSFWEATTLYLKAFQYKKSFKLTKGFDMKYNTSNSLCISSSHLDPRKVQHPTSWAMKIALYLSIKGKCQMPVG